MWRLRKKPMSLSIESFTKGSVKLLSFKASLTFVTAVLGVWAAWFENQRRLQLVS